MELRLQNSILKSILTINSGKKKGCVLYLNTIHAKPKIGSKIENFGPKHKLKSLLLPLLFVCMSRYWKSSCM